MQAQPTKHDESTRSPTSGLARALDEADPDTPIEEIGQLASERTRYRCPECGWTADLRRQTCFRCDYDDVLEPTEGVSR